MQTALMTTPELLERDRQIGLLLDQAPTYNGQDLAEAKDLIRQRREVRGELERRHVASTK